MPYLKAKHLSGRAKRLNEKLEAANRNLIYMGGEIRFQSEKDLEDYIEAYTCLLARHFDFRIYRKNRNQIIPAIIPNGT